MRIKEIKWNIIYKNKGEHSSLMCLSRWDEAKAVYDALSQICDEVTLVSVETATSILEKNFEGEPSNYIYA